MFDTTKLEAVWAPRVLSVLRIMAAALMMQHGVQKMFGLLGKEAAVMFTLPWVAGMIEFFGGVLVLVGLYTRAASFLMSGLMAVAYFMAHAPQGFWPVLNKGELAVIYCFVYLYLWAAGPGPWSLDAKCRGVK